jgi:hypothetical protein
MEGCAMFPTTSYDPDTLTRAFNEAWLAVQGMLGKHPLEDDVADEPTTATRALIDGVTEATWNEALGRLGKAPSNPLPLWMILAARILRAVADGERDPERLKRLALEGLDGRGWLAE